MKGTWGENLIGNAGLWLGFGIVSFGYILLSVGLVIAALQVSDGLAISLGIVLVLGLLLIGIVKSAISAIYTAALYRFATDGQAPHGFEGPQMASAFEQK